MGNIINLLIELIGFGVIVYGLTIAIQSVVFKNFDAAYKKAVKPIIIWCLAFVAINFDLSIMGYNSFGSFWGYVEQQMSGAQALFGNLGALIAGKQASDQMISYLRNNAVADDLYDRSLLMACIGFIATVVILILSILTIRSVKRHHHYKKSKLKVFFFISASLTSFLIGAYVTLLKAANDVNHYEYEVDSLMPLYWLLGTAISLGLMYYYYIAKYINILDRVYDTKPVITQPTYQNITISAVASYGDKPTKTCPYCGETILAVATKCKHCGEWLPVEEAKKMIECKVCGEKVEEGTIECPFCHERVDGSGAHEHTDKPKMITCPICAEQIPDNVEVCPFCNEKIK